MIREPVNAARNESAPAQTIHRPLHRRGIPENVIALGAFRYASHESDRSTGDSRQLPPTDVVSTREYGNGVHGFVANTDYDWFNYLRAIEPPIDEVNFWKPGSGTNFGALIPGEPLFFKLKAPHNTIAGFGYFAHFSRLPVSMVWQVYGEANGAGSYGEMRDRLVRIRRRFDSNIDAKQDFWIGCILVNQPVFFEESNWVRMPADFKGPTVQGEDLRPHYGRRAAHLDGMSRPRLASLGHACYVSRRAAPFARRAHRRRADHLGLWLRSCRSASPRPT